MPNTAYATRCKCYGQGVSCSLNCRCKNCSNPNGARPDKSGSSKRIRRPHEMQITLPDSKMFAEDRGEDMSTGSWSIFESIVLQEILNPENETIDKVYSDIVYYANSNFCTIQRDEAAILRAKTKAQIQKKLSTSGRSE